MNNQPKFDEGQRQMVLLALQKLRLERPGWDYALGLVEAKLGGQFAWPPFRGNMPGVRLHGRVRLSCWLLMGC